MRHFVTRMTRLLILALAALACHGCNVHEYPDTSGEIDVILHLTYDTNMPVIYKPAAANSASGSFDPAFDAGAVRYIVKVYHRGESGPPMREFSFTRDARGGISCDQVVRLPTGDYDILVWTDLRESASSPYYYDATDFTGILLAGDSHRGSTNYRDAFYGKVEFKADNDGVERRTPEVTVAMERPLARYEFISDDLKQFVIRELNRYHTSGAERVADDAGAQGETGSQKEIDLEDYRVRFHYVGFMPSEFNLFTDRPVDSRTGVVFDAAIRQTSAGEASIGFDYVFVNHAETTISVQVELTHKDGSKVALTDPVDVPLRRGHNTEVRGKFLTATAANGIAINTEFDGEFNLIF